MTEDFTEALDSADRLGHVVCGTIRADGTPVYFTMPDSASDQDVQEMAFLGRHGRQMSGYEKMLLALAVEEREAS